MKKFTSGIYKITNIVNSKCYIGKTEKCIEKRWKDHIYYLNKGTHHNRHLQAAWIKYGENCFSFNLIEELNSNVDSNTLERFWISKYKSNHTEFGYNMTNGGEGCLGRKHTERAKSKISLAQKGCKKSEEHKEKLRNRNFSDETRAKMSAAKKGRVLSNDHKMKISKKVQNLYTV